MKKNRIIAAIWISFICIVVLAIIGYVVYANIEHPYMAFNEEIRLISKNIFKFLGGK